MLSSMIYTDLKISTNFPHLVVQRWTHITAQQIMIPLQLVAIIVLQTNENTLKDSLVSKMKFIDFHFSFLWFIIYKSHV